MFLLLPVTWRPQRAGCAPEVESEGREGPGGVSPPYGHHGGSFYRDVDGCPSYLYPKGPNLSLKLFLHVLALLDWTLCHQSLYNLTGWLCNVDPGAQTCALEIVPRRWAVRHVTNPIEESGHPWMPHLEPEPLWSFDQTRHERDPHTVKAHGLVLFLGSSSLGCCLHHCQKLAPITFAHRSCGCSQFMGLFVESCLRQQKPPEAKTRDWSKLLIICQHAAKNHSCCLRGVQPSACVRVPRNEKAAPTKPSRSPTRFGGGILGGGQ